MPLPPLTPPDSHFLTAAIGWVELRNPGEARTELDRVSVASRTHPDFLEVAWIVHSADSDWEQARIVAERLVEVAPDRPTGWLHRAYALRRVAGGGVGTARAALVPAAALFPAESTIPYNLACYACQLGEQDAAREWLRQAVAIAGREVIRSMALQDEDLRVFHSEIERW